MPFCTHTVYLDGVKTRELKRTASTPDLTDFDKERIAENLDSKVADLVPELHRMSINAHGRAWPKNRVPYTVSTELQYGHPDIYKALTIALKAFREQIKSVKWVERENEADFVKFVYGDECSSHVGCVGGQQEITLTDWATPGNVLHEMGHAIGLHHEHSRIDRNHFVDVRIKEKDVNFDKEESGIPLGPYDYSSIMHYGAHAGSIIAHASKQSGQMGQRKEFSSLDVKGIDSIYGPLKCSFEQCGDVYWPQIWIECRTCWGDESNYGCCFVCALDCHSGPDHFLVSHQLSAEAMFACDCGRNHHQTSVCTWHSTKTKNVKQPFYNCRDCFQNTSQSCCYQCMKTCHAGHHTSYAGIMNGYCDCGMKCCRIICKIPNPTCSDRCTYETAGETYPSQPWYECRTCWGGESNYGCCLSCAFNCHNGHVLVYHPEEKFICDCGRNHHQKAVCTWHSTKTKNVKQPFYNCRDCFQNTSQSCCYQCMKTCHAGHHTSYAGIMNGYCDCGMKCCRIICKIPNPTCSDRCTYETAGETYPSQPWYECRTCWGGESNYGCCLSCAFNCHNGHVLVYHPEEKFICDCGRNCHQKAVCTWRLTRKEGAEQPFYHCYDCFTHPDAGCCYQCMQKCHAGHNTRFASIMKGYCNCGLEHCRSSCLIPKPLTCTYKSRGEDYHLQYWYHCYTCWGGESNYGCCSYCAFNCHRNHHLVYQPGKKVTAVCDCGRNDHQQAVCTWHSTRRKYVKQPFYLCFDCFTYIFRTPEDVFEGCCYQCMKKCHAGHNTAYAGILDAFCDCGMMSCRIRCSILSPK